MTHPVTIREMPARRLAAIAKTGPYNETGQAINTLFAALGARGLIDKVGEVVCIYHDDPDTVPAADLRMHAAVDVPGDLAVDAPLDGITLQAGRYAVMRYTGPFAGLQAAYGEFYGTWLPASGETPAEAPNFETYPGFSSETPPDKQVTEMWMLLS